jgi:hypothetical protein
MGPKMDAREVNRLLALSAMSALLDALTTTRRREGLQRLGDGPQGGQLLQTLASRPDARLAGSRCRRDKAARIGPCDRLQHHNGRGGGRSFNAPSATPRMQRAHLAEAGSPGRAGEVDETCELHAFCPSARALGRAPRRRVAKLLHVAREALNLSAGVRPSGPGKIRKLNGRHGCFTRRVHRVHRVDTSRLAGNLGRLRVVDSLKPTLGKDAFMPALNVGA